MTPPPGPGQATASAAADSVVQPDAEALLREVTRLKRRLDRERAARREAEVVAERGLSELFRRQQETALLESIANAANSATSVDKVLELALAGICEFMGWPVGHAFMVSPAPDDGAGHLISSGIAHVQKGLSFATLREASFQVQLGKGEGLPGLVWRTGHALVERVRDDDPRATLVRRAGLNAGMAFPVAVGTEVVAVLEFMAPSLSEPEESLLRLMCQVSTQLALVIERERANAKLLHDSTHDSLTMLANRALFIERLKHVLAITERDPSAQFAVLFVDLDRFKGINDSLGHHLGDELLIQVSRRVTGCLRGTDLVLDSQRPMVARLGGDEFTILLENLSTPADAVRVAERLLRRIAEPFVIAGRQLFVTASIGIAFSDNDYPQVVDILRDADIAMYRAKAAGRARWELFDAGMRDRAVRRLQDEEDLHAALDQGQFSLAYQPIVSLDGVIQGFEALLRWIHPSRGFVNPSETVALAEEIGLIDRLGEWVLHTACAQAALWQRVFDRPFFISVNVSQQQLDGTSFITAARSALRDHGLLPGTLRLEITETTLMRDPARARAVLEELRSAGIEFSLDDFGTGYSSLAQLRQLPLQTLKLDRAFVTDMDRDCDKREIARLVVSLGQLLGMKIVAEGAETAAEVEVLRRLGCDFIQGYHFYRPLPPDEIADVLSGFAANA